LTWLIRTDLFIDEDFRNKGYGRKMIFAVKEKAIEQGCYRLKWVTQYGNAARKLYDQIATCEFVQYRMDW
jgi:GNAT superfamily N-acetyltransferase